jgi:hypothetical protein
LRLLRKAGGLQIPYPFSSKSEFSIFRNEIMVKSRYFKFYNYFGKFREPPVEGLWGKNFENGEGANESLPFFVGGNHSHFQNYAYKYLTQGITHRFLKLSIKFDNVLLNEGRYVRKV